MNNYVSKINICIIYILIINMKLNDNNSKAPYILTINKINTEYKKQNINKNNNNNNKKKEFIFKQEFSPLSGSEPIYEPQKWIKYYKV